MPDPYDTLGVRRADTPETIRRAYRKLAKKHHPDLNPGKPEAAEQFKALNAAHDLLSDPERRARFDRGEIDAEGNPSAPRDFWRAHGEAAGGRQGDSAAGQAAGFSAEDLESLFGQAFRSGGGGGAEDPFATMRSRGADVQYALTIDFMDAARGAVRRLSLPEGRTLDVTIPAGVRDGHVMRLRAQGRPGRNGGNSGDALLEINVAPHPFFRRDGDDVVLRLPVTLQEAVLGASVEVPTIGGRVRLTIPAGSTSGTRLRLRGRGVGEGDQYVELEVRLPHEREPALADFLRDWEPEHPFDPRAALLEA